MKTVAILAVLCGISAGYSIPPQNAYYRQPMGFRTVQRTMYGVHFQNFQNEALKNQGVSDFVAGTHPNDCHQTDVENADWPVQNPNVGSTADAYPSEQYPVEDELHQDIPTTYEDEPEEPIADEPFAAPAVPAVVPALIPEKKKKKVPVQIDSNEEEEQVAQGGAANSNGSNTYFPITFGSASGGAIAIANSYSTGKGGSATSTATAYGNPATAELRRNSATQLRRKPSKLRNRQ